MPDEPRSSRLLAGPVLCARGSDGGCLRVSVLTVTSDQEPVEVAAEGTAAGSARRLDDCGGRVAWRHDIELPLGERAVYRCDGRSHQVCAAFGNGVRVAYVSCNGQERGDRERPIEERNRLWQRLADEHGRAPFSLLLHGGDQLYADEVLGAHPDITAWHDSDLDERAGLEFTDAAREAASRYLFERYLALYAQPGIAELLARVPSIMMWDDHDIIDGWGSHAEALLDSPVGRGLFENARRWFRVFQQAEAPDDGAVSLSSVARFETFAVIAPDLRSERRPERILGEAGWRHLDAALEASRELPQVFLMSSVPLLGPRLSWLEALIPLLPRLRRYEDDLRDQWQSRAHRPEWRRMLQTLELAFSAGRRLTVLSGEIHLASRGEMPFGAAGTLHQLIASGISHPEPPTGWARALGSLARLGEDPVPGRPIRLRPVPGQGGIYTAERNYLVLERVPGAAPRWQAAWELESSGRSPPLVLG